MTIRCICIAQILYNMLKINVPNLLLESYYDDVLQTLVSNNESE